MLVDAPYPDDRVSSSSEEPIESGVQLQRIHPISVVFFHLVPNHVGHLMQKGTSVTIARVSTRTHFRVHVSEPGCANCKVSR